MVGSTEPKVNSGASVQREDDQLSQPPGSFLPLGWVRTFLDRWDLFHFLSLPTRNSLSKMGLSPMAM